MNPPEVQSGDSFKQSRGLLVVFFCLAAVIAYMQRTAIGGAASLIQDSLGVSKARFGLIMSMYYWAYAVGQIPAALLIRRIGTGRALSLSVGLASVFAAATALSGSWQLFAVLWLLTGVSIAGIFPACVRSISTAFPAGHRAFPSGALTSAMSVGGGISSAMTGRMIQWLTGMAADPWRWVFLIYAIPGVIWAFVFYGWYREPAVAADAQAAKVSDETAANAAAPLDHSRWVFDYRTWLICLQQFFRAAGYVFYATWFTSYLEEFHGITLVSAGVMTSFPLLGVVIGGIAGGWLCDLVEVRTGSRRLARQGAGVVCHVTCGLLILCAYFVSSPFMAVGLITAGSVVFALGSSGSYAVNMDLGGKRAPELFALMNMCGNIGAAISPFVVGKIVETSGWSPVLPFFSGLYFAAGTCWIFLRPGSGQVAIRSGH